jgi:hypothetical protein
MAQAQMVHVRQSLSAVPAASDTLARLRVSFDAASLQNGMFWHTLTLSWASDKIVPVFTLETSSGF